MRFGISPGDRLTVSPPAPARGTGGDRAVRTEADIAVANVVGSNIFNVLRRARSYVADRPPAEATQPVRFEVPCGLSVMVVGAGWANRPVRWAADCRSNRLPVGRSGRAREAKAQDGMRRGSASLRWDGWHEIVFVLGGDAACWARRGWWTAPCPSLADQRGSPADFVAANRVPLATSWNMAMRGERDIAVGQCCDSVCDLLNILGIAALERGALGGTGAGVLRRPRDERLCS